MGLSRVEWRHPATEEQNNGASDNVMNLNHHCNCHVTILISSGAPRSRFRFGHKFASRDFNVVQSYLHPSLTTSVMSDTLAAGSSALSKEEKKRLKKEKREAKEREDKEVEVPVAEDKPEESKEERRARKAAKKAVSRDVGHPS
jgi:hypothetical protein